jgi:uncharacterized protein YbaR (Trm112 family)
VFIELVDDLRCPRPHEETWLVASADRTVGRDIVEGTLGCPVCHAEYPIREGAVWFGEPQRRSSAPVGEQYAPPELATRIAAFLNLVDPPGFALLLGAWSEVAPFLKGVVPTHVVVLSPTTHVDSRNGISVVHVAEGIPFGDASCRGVALDDSYATSEGIAAAVRVLAPRGRLVAPARTSLPAGVTELARDDRLWVAERAASPSQLVTLRAREPGG